jgi:hypothetical protein
MPASSVLGCGRASTTTAAPAISAHPRSAARREAMSATDSGPRNSRVTASPSPTRSTAVYRDRFMVAKISPSAATGPHCRRVNARNRGRTAPSSTAPATHWRIATTPAGPSAGKASAALAAPS